MHPLSLASGPFSSVQFRDFAYLVLGLDVGAAGIAVVWAVHHIQATRWGTLRIFAVTYRSACPIASSCCNCMPTNEISEIFVQIQLHLILVMRILGWQWSLSDGKVYYMHQYLFFAESEECLLQYGRSSYLVTGYNILLNRFWHLILKSSSVTMLIVASYPNMSSWTLYTSIVYYKVSYDFLTYSSSKTTCSA